MKPIYLSLLTLVLAGVVSYATTKAVQPKISSEVGVAVEKNVKKKGESVYDRVMRTGKIRCGYLVWPPATIRDENTGKMSGIMPDYMEALGEALNLEIVWEQELNLATYLEDLNTGKIDVECSGGWPNALRGKKVEYTKPFFFMPMYAVVKMDDNRFDNNYEAINNSNVKVAVSDGATDGLLRQRRFPKAGSISLPQISSLSDRILSVTTGKADVIFLDYSAIIDFQKNNSNKIRKVEGEPLRLVPNNLSFAAGEFRLQQMLNTATNELIYDGVIGRILDKYEPAPGAFLRPAKPYEVSE